MVGIPYAKATVTDNGQLVHECPICGDDILEQHDSTGEQTSNRYAEHYANEHADRSCDRCGKALDADEIECDACAAHDDHDDRAYQAFKEEGRR